jgi:hypothetical protein
MLIRIALLIIIICGVSMSSKSLNDSASWEAWNNGVATGKSYPLASSPFPDTKLPKFDLGQCYDGSKVVGQRLTEAGMKVKYAYDPAMAEGRGHMWVLAQAPGAQGWQAIDSHFGPVNSPEYYSPKYSSSDYGKLDAMLPAPIYHETIEIDPVSHKPTGKKTVKMGNSAEDLAGQVCDTFMKLYNFNENHDELGRFSEGGGVGKGSKPISGRNVDPYEPDKMPDDLKQALDSAQLKNLNASQYYAVQSYAAQEYRNVNRLHCNPEKLSEFERQQAQKISDDLDTIFENASLKNDMNVYRGFGPDMLNRYPDLAEALRTPGSEIELPGFTSTSIRGNKAVDFNGNKGEGGFIMEMTLPKGSKAVYLGDLGMSGEMEMLINRGARIKITSAPVEEEIIDVRAGYETKMHYAVGKAEVILT